MRRTTGLTQEDHDTVKEELRMLSRMVAALGNVLGPAYGAAWCDKCLNVMRALDRLEGQVADEHYRRTGGD